MAQTKHTFVESKMNKDLDDRLLSGGQYRDALNVAVSKSEDSDVGALENVLGNDLISSLFQANQTIPPNLQVIGGYVSNEKNSIYLFLTNYCDNSVNSLDNIATSGASCFIVEYNISTNSSNFLIQGDFLNFSTTHPVLGINIIEDLLFWTDNRNQPRKINIETAKKFFGSSPYYINEDQISVAKYAPVLPPNILDTTEFKDVIYYKDYDWNPWANTGSFQFPKDGASLVFYNNSNPTGNATPEAWPGIDKFKKYDQFAFKNSDKIYNIADINTTGSNIGFVVYPKISSQSLTTATDIEIFVPTAIDATSEYLPSTARISLENTAIGANTINAGTAINLSSSGSTIVQWESPRVPWQIMGSDAIFTGCGVFSSLIDETKTDSSGNRLNGIKFTAANVTQNAPAAITLQQDITLAGKDKAFLDLSLPNPNYKSQFAGDKENLKDKFVRFAYRFKYDDNEYSLTSPFTQPVFVPNQNGYMLNTSQAFNSGLNDNIVNQQDQAGTETVLSWFENKLNQIGLNIPMEYNVNEMFSKLKIVELQILYKESNEGRLQVVDDIDFTLNNLLVLNNNTKKFTYQYQSGKPFKSLPPDVITRTSDKVPIKALAQESAGNRIIYGNFLDKHTSPLTLDYLVSTGEKLGPNDNGTIDSFAQYPNHTLKQNRTYQVGVILQDRYGRQTDVILAEPLADNKEEIPANSGNFYGDSTVYHSYKSSSFSGSQSMIEWPGDSLKVLFRNKIPTELNNRPGYPGLYDANTNPLGFYSYKVVVKQKQQEYYNVYLPSLLYGVPIGGSVSIAWNSLNSSDLGIVCNEPAPGPSNTIITQGTNLTGLQTTTGLKPGMKFVLKANSFTNSNSSTDCCPPNNVNNPCPNVCGNNLTTNAQCATYTITSIVDDSTISFSPKAAFTYAPYCEHTPGVLCCDKTPGSSTDVSLNCGTAANGPGTLPSTSVKNSQPTPELVFTQDGTTVILNPKTVNSPSEMTTTLLTDNINKMPADLNDVRPNQEQFSTSDDIYFARVAMNQADKFVIIGGDLNNTPLTGTSLVYSSQVDTSIKSDVVKILASYQDLFPTTDKPSGLYKTSTNPFTSIMSNSFQIGSVSDEPQTFTSLETEPVMSELDIFWETSSTGLISELNNTVIGLDPDGTGTSVDVIGIGGSVDFNQNESLVFTNPNPTPVNVGKVFAVNSTGIVSSSIILVSVRDGAGVNLDSSYDIIKETGTNNYILRALQGCVFVESEVKNQRKFTFSVTDTQPSPSNNLTNFYSYETSINNDIPVFVGYATAANGGITGYPNNPQGKINLTPYVNNAFSTVGTAVVLGSTNSSVTINNTVQPNADTRIYFKNGSGADFYDLGISINEYSQVVIEMEVSRTDQSQGGSNTFVPIQPQNVPVNVVTNTNSGTTIVNGGISTPTTGNKNSPTTTNVTSGGGVVNKLYGSGSTTNTTSVAAGALQSVNLNGGSSTVSTNTIEAYDGFFFAPAGSSDSILTPASYNIPDGVTGYIVGWYGGYYVSENPEIFDTNGQILTDPITNQPYVINGGVAAVQDFNFGPNGVGWLEERFFRFVIKDANGTSLALTNTIGTNVIGQQGIKIEFNIIAQPITGVIRSFSNNTNLAANQNYCGFTPVADGYNDSQSVGGGNSGNGMNSTDEGAYTGSNQTIPTGSSFAPGNNPFNIQTLGQGQAVRSPVWMNIQ